jgi:hypothetical protein
MNNPAEAYRPGYSTDLKDDLDYDVELQPYASLFLRPFAQNKSQFTRKELEAMCKDPLHSPRLIMYLIEMVKAI